MDGPCYRPDTDLSTTMAAEPIVRTPPDRDVVACSVCKHRITDPGPVAHCPSCGWQEKQGAD